jgi:intracellular sulfur oxidation DsrE/DsrF family protein
LFIVRIARNTDSPTNAAEYLWQLFNITTIGKIRMNKNTGLISKFIFGFLISLLLGMGTTAFADSDAQMSENTKPPLQIINQTGLKVVVQINYDSTIPNGISKQVLATKNLYDQYSALGMKSGKDFEIVMVFRADGAQFLLTDEAYDAKVKQPHVAGNPSKEILDTLSKNGVKMYECGVAMKLKGYKPKDILPVSRVVVSGIGAMVDFEKSGFISITP